MVWGIIIIVDLIPKIIPLSSEQIKIAGSNISKNSDWDPIIRRINGSDKVLVPNGCFSMGSNFEQLIIAQTACDSFFGGYECREDFEVEQPAHDVCFITPYWIDITPVTNWQYGSSSNQGTDTSPNRDLAWPRETVNWQEAFDFCAQKGSRLPTEAEWEYAARGPDSLIYPFGNKYIIEYVTLSKVYPDPVGKNPEGASWVGALDMSGGIGEWVEDWFSIYSDEYQVNPKGPTSGEFKILRGGSWFAHEAYSVRTSYRDIVPPNYATSVVGFRCAADFIPK